MRGLMMDTPLLISSIIDHGATVYADQQIVSRTVEGPIHRYTYFEARRRAKQLANALESLGVQAGDRIATVAWNGYRHFEIYYAVSGMGAICHTLNPRLHPVQLEYIINHAEDCYIFADLTFVPLLETVQDKLASVRGFVIMTDRSNMPDTTFINPLCYEELIDSHSDEFDWPQLEENTASSLCYTSGTTGNPKGVLYSHRSTVLHSYALALPNAFQLGERQCVLPIVPMFHANAWGIPYAAPMTGVKLVMPGPALDGASLAELMTNEGVTMTAGVPTVCLGLLNYLEEANTSVPTLERVVIGGAAVPQSMIEAFEHKLGVEVRQAWGMTEMSPLGTVSTLKPEMRAAPEPEQYRIQGKQGRPVFGVNLKIVDEQNKRLPHDGNAFGDLRVRGPWICDGYYRLDHSPAHDADGWFSTGDVATVDESWYMQITDRKKDLIKSGGEWISSVELENTAAGHPDVAQAAVIAVPDEKWDERPLLVVVPKANASPSKEAIRDYLQELVPKWWVPDEVVFVEHLPLGATGKVLKNKLREEYAGRTTAEG